MTRLPIALVCAGGLMLASCGPKPPGAPEPATVVVAAPVMAQAPNYIELTGTVAASASADLVARTAGTIIAKGFADGDFVKRGQVLFRIEPDSASAQLDLNRAKEVQAREDYAREQRLLAQDAASKAEVEAARANLDQAAANTRIARINLDNTVIRAPFDGYASAAAADVGAYVGGAGAVTRLATVQRIAPVYINFTLGERDVLRLLGGARAPNIVPRGYPVRVGLQGEEGFPHAGRLDFAGRAIDATSGSLQARAVVANGPKSALLPGMFARVRIETGPAEPMMLLPARTIQSDPLGDYVLVVDGKGVVRRRDVRTGRDVGTSREVVGGLTLRDRVIVDGLAGARIGQPARVRDTVLPAVTID